jgi:hypothetical protein
VNKETTFHQDYYYSLEGILDSLNRLQLITVSKRSREEYRFTLTQKAYNEVAST